jgi:hydroxymethylpyrimidine pyrophosphatase-like HAD family hydrolase
MYRRIVAFNFDSTLAQKGIVPLALKEALKHLHRTGYALFLVTGRRFGSFELGSLRDIVTGIVWENGAVLHHTRSDEIYLPFGHIAPRLLEELKAAEVPLEQGRATVSTQAPYDETVWHVLSKWGGDAAVTHDKGTVIIAPPGAAKGAGLERLMGLCGLSPRNLISFGDGESDLSLLQLGEIGIAVADAPPSLKAVADLVTTRPGPDGVLEMLEAFWLNGDPCDIPSPHACPIPLGEDESGTSVSVPAAVLASGCLGIFGDSGTGKSWVAGLLAEGMQHVGYQTLLIDPEGDFRSMRALPGFVALEGDLPSPALVAMLLETAPNSVVLDLCEYPTTRRCHYLADLLDALRSLKGHKFRPHWVVLEEAQYFLPPGGNSVSSVLFPMLADGGWAFVSYRPDRLTSELLPALDHCILTRLSEPEAVQAVRKLFSGVGDVALADISQGHACLCGDRVVNLRPGVRRVPHIRHLYKYLDTPLPKHKRFRFRDEQRFLGEEAASLLEFLHCLDTLPVESLVYHHARGDFIAWASNALGDRVLAGYLRKLTQRALDGEALRQALSQRVADHYEELLALRRGDTSCTSL